MEKYKGKYAKKLGELNKALKDPNFSLPKGSFLVFALRSRAIVDPISTHPDFTVYRVGEITRPERFMLIQKPSDKGRGFGISVSLSRKKPSVDFQDMVVTEILRNYSVI